MLRYLGTGVVLLAVGSVLGVPAPAAAGSPDAPKPPTVDAFIHNAITAGLADDGVPLALAGDIAKRDDFLGKCALCRPSRKAIADYGDRRVQPVAKDGKGLPEELVKRLKSDTAEVRQPALRELVGRYVDRALATSELTAEQQAALQTDMERVRKDGEKILAKGQKFCPSCDGACRLNLKP